MKADLTHLDRLETNLVGAYIEMVTDNPAVNDYINGRLKLLNLGFDHMDQLTGEQEDTVDLHTKLILKDLFMKMALGL